ncbi:MAG TPA: S-methyl-5-thioribose-1-phosphate isomerase [Myxococcota bacterium]|nr:S-methyl-5-thioribose-1-phosphate isomerase [Myxococcota bacterium]
MSWRTLRWHAGAVLLLDQRALPEREQELACGTVEELASAIEQLVVRGAPAIGCAAAYGVALAAQRSEARSLAALARELADARARLLRTRPTAVNLAWALARMQRCEERAARAQEASVASVASALLAEAHALTAEDERICRALGRAGAELVPDGARVLTHCNAGALATAGYGTALGVVRAAVEAGRRVSVLADETRPFLQGARLTAWELQRDGIPVTVIADAMAAHLMRGGEIDLAIVGADRIAANGDVANKIGTYGLAVAAHHHGIPLIVVAPTSTLDASIASGAEIPIEERAPEEVSSRFRARNPAFDVTPAELVDAIVTEHGVHRAPYADSLPLALPAGR